MIKNTSRAAILHKEFKRLDIPCQIIAAKMGMAHKTFLSKLDVKQERWFDDEEILLLRDAVADYSSEINSFAFKITSK